MPGVQLIQIAGKEIIYIDYSGCKPMEMIDVFNQAKEAVISKNGECLLLTNFESCYITPPFMRHAEKEMLIVSRLIKRNSFIGMTIPQQMILKGFRHFIGKEEYAYFNTRQEAIDYLICEEPVSTAIIG